MRTVHSISFYVPSNAETRRASVAEVTKTALYQGTSPMRGGLLDPRLGAARGVRCATCGGDVLRCPGHFGHLEIAPTWHPLLLRTAAALMDGVTLKYGKLRHKKKLLSPAAGRPLLPEEWRDRLILEALPVPPVCVRPSMHEGNRSGQAALTLKLQVFFTRRASGAATFPPRRSSPFARPVRGR